MREFIPPKSSFFEHNKTYDDYIKLHLKYKLSNKPKVIDYGCTINIYYDGFWFRVIMESYKIDIRKDYQYIKDEVIQNKVIEIINIIEKYYPELYENKYKTWR